MSNDPVPDTIKPEWSAPACVKVVSTLRQGGFSQAPYDSFNLAEHVGDEQACVFRNRQLLKQAYSLPAEPNWLEQTHSTRVVNLENDTSRSADAAITRRMNTVAVVMTADCLPVLLCNRAGTEVAVIHAGWRGLADGVIQETLNKMHSCASELMAWIGPGISRHFFEVGDEVRDIFLLHSGQNRPFFISARAGHWLCDLQGIASSILERRGVAEVGLAPACSYRDEAQFFSYRRSATTGRMASLIWIEP
jgi:YfiH family protein